MESSVSIIRNIEALASRAESIRYHLVVDRSPSMLRLSLSRRSSWHGMPLNRLTLHSVAQLPASVIDLHRRLSSSATGPGPIYLWKPIFHRVLPEDISKVIILDTDVFLFTDIQRLWNHFRNFGSGEMLGIAQEQCPSYQEVRALGGVGYNGGVQLLDLFAMRSSADYNAAIETYAAARWGKRASAGAPPMKDGGIGWLGDQTLYSWMSVNSTGHRRFFHDLPCGWNRQIGTHMSSWPRFWRTHACHMPCRLLHGNFVEHKGFMEELKADPTGASCTDVVDRHRLTDPKFKDGTADARMLDVVRRTCCPANVTRLVGSNKAQRPHPP